MSLMDKSYACAIRKERKKINIEVVKHIRTTKKLIEEAKYAESIKNLKDIYYVLMVPSNQRKDFKNFERRLDMLAETELINEKIMIEKELGKRTGEGSQFVTNFVLSSEIGIITGVLVTCLFNQYVSSDVINISWLFLGVLVLFIIINQLKRKKELLYSLCLDAVEQLIEESNRYKKELVDKEL